MIKTFKDAGLEAFFTTGSTRKLSVREASRVQRIRLMLLALQVAKHPRDMDQPGWRFHSLAPMRPADYSLKVTGNWRLTFAWEGEDAVDVNLEDYH